MKLTKYKLGDLIELYSENCNITNLTINDVSGINRDKEFFEPSKQVGTNTSKYKIVPPNYFACNLMHVGRDKVLPVSLNHTNKNKIVSPAYTVFKVKNIKIMLITYFFIFLKSNEKDRLFWMNTDSSIREGLDWNVFCDIDITLPPIDIQQKYVDIYKGMLENQKSYETGLEDLKLTCDAYIDRLKHDRKLLMELSFYIKECNLRNKEKVFNSNDIKGVNNSSEFIPTKANTLGLKVTNYKIVNCNDFVYNPSRINIGSIALYKDESCIVSPMYTVFKVNDNKNINSDYLMIWFERIEFQRSTLFYATGSVRDTFSFDIMKEVKIPIPPIEIQNAIADIYAVYKERKSINERLKEQLKDICPILIKGSLEEARRG